MPTKAHFDRKLFGFLRDLARHNNKEWFAENRSRYDEDVKQPLLAFIADFSIHLGKITDSYVSDPRPLGGSMFRIHRDIRFSKDKRPYKTAASAQFRHRAGKNVHAPGFYLHLEPDNVFAGVGLWHPDASSLASIRERIVNEPDAWKRAAYGKAFHTMFTMSGDTLKRAPAGVEPNHLYIQDLRRKDFIAVTQYTEADACSEGFIEVFSGGCNTATPFMRFLTESVGLPF